MSKRWLAVWIVAAMALLIGGPIVAIINDDTLPEPDAPTLDQASHAAERFFERYLDDDGRVVRHDQDGDTVSEGQAYAMLIAVAVGDRAKFDSSWEWSKNNLRQPNGLFAWKWKDGKVLDPQSATDADLDMARALIVAAEYFNDQRYATEARELAKSIADNELVRDRDGSPVIVAGPWARSAPYLTNPSYHSPRAERELSRLTGDSIWVEAMRTQRELIDALDGTSEDPLLPPDWATVQFDGSVTASSPPGSSSPARYSYDAVRTPIRLAESCDPADRAQAAQMWKLLNKSRQAKSSAGISLDGDVQERAPTAVGSVAAAAAAKAAGDTQQLSTLLDVADRIDTNEHTYYGAAWAALGRIMLTTEWLGTC